MTTQQFLSYRRPRGWGGGGYSHTLPLRVCAAQRGRHLSSWFRKGYPFQRRFVERGIIFRTHKSSSFVSNHLKLFKDRLLLKIRLNALLKQTVILLLHPRTEYKKLAHFQNGVSVLARILERGIKNWPISRTGYQFQGNFFLERGTNLESRAAHTHPKNTQVPPHPPGL